MEQYEGFKNEPTCIVANYFRENKETQGYWTMKAEGLTREELIKELILEIEEIHNPLVVKASMYSKLLGYAISLIDWDEIADTLKEEDKQ